MKLDPIKPGCTQVARGQPKLSTVKLDRIPVLITMAWAMKSAAMARGMTLAQWRRAADEAALQGNSPKS